MIERIQSVRLFVLSTNDPLIVAMKIVLGTRPFSGGCARARQHFAQGNSRRSWSVQQFSRVVDCTQHFNIEITTMQ
jgi:hypothetical protein